MSEFLFKMTVVAMMANYNMDYSKFHKEIASITEDEMTLYSTVFVDLQMRDKPITKVQTWAFIELHHHLENCSDAPGIVYAELLPDLDFIWARYALIMNRRNQLSHYDSLTNSPKYVEYVKDLDFLMMCYHYMGNAKREAPIQYRRAALKSFKELVGEEHFYNGFPHHVIWDYFDRY